MKKEVTIIGGGIAGLTTAIALEQKGIKTNIFEAAPEIKAIGAGLGLGANAIMAFRKIGLIEEVVQAGRILPKFIIYDQKGKTITVTDSEKLNSKYGIDNFTIHRAELHSLLMSKLDPQQIHLNKRAVGFKLEGDTVTVTFQNGTHVNTKYLIVADGVHSSIRQILLPASKIRYAGYTCWRAIIDNSKLNLKESSESWGRGVRFGIVPLADNKVYWFACKNANANDANFKNYKIKDLLKIFGNFHDPIPAILKETKDENLLWNDIVDIKPIDQFAFDNILLIGDAAHATTPNMGQGACQAIEDAVILASEMSKATEFTEAFRNFEKRRLKRTHFITNTSWSVGKIAQLENTFLAALRNFIFRSLPKSVNEKQLSRLYKVDMD